MTTLWQRFLRLWHEPRIRLSAPGLRARDLRSGDRLQIGSRLWRVEALSDADPATTFELTAVDGPPDRAWLRAAAGCWTLAAGPAGPRAIDLDPADVVHFPVSQPADA